MGDQIKYIPVMLSFEHSEPIGHGVVNEEGELIITVKQKSVNDFVHRLRGGTIAEIYLGFGGPLPRKEESEIPKEVSVD